MDPDQHLIALINAFEKIKADPYSMVEDIYDGNLTPLTILLRLHSLPSSAQNCRSRDDLVNSINNHLETVKVHLVRTPDEARLLANFVLEKDRACRAIIIVDCNDVETNFSLIRGAFRNVKRRIDVLWHLQFNPRRGTGGLPLSFIRWVNAGSGRRLADANPGGSNPAESDFDFYTRTSPIRGSTGDAGTSTGTATGPEDEAARQEGLLKRKKHDKDTRRTKAKFDSLLEIEDDGSESEKEPYGDATLEPESSHAEYDMLELNHLIEEACMLDHAWLSAAEMLLTKAKNAAQAIQEQEKDRLEEANRLLIQTTFLEDGWLSHSDTLLNRQELLAANAADAMQSQEGERIAEINQLRNEAALLDDGWVSHSETLRNRQELLAINAADALQSQESERLEEATHLINETTLLEEGWLSIADMLLTRRALHAAEAIQSQESDRLEEVNQLMNLTALLDDGWVSHSYFVKTMLKRQRANAKLVEDASEFTKAYDARTKKKTAEAAAAAEKRAEGQDTPRRASGRGRDSPRGMQTPLASRNRGRNSPRQSPPLNVNPNAGAGAATSDNSVQNEPLDYSVSSYADDPDLVKISSAHLIERWNEQWVLVEKANEEKLAAEKMVVEASQIVKTITVKFSGGSTSSEGSTSQSNNPDVNLLKELNLNWKILEKQKRLILTAVEKAIAADKRLKDISRELARRNISSE